MRIIYIIDRGHFKKNQPLRSPKKLARKKMLKPVIRRQPSKSASKPIVNKRKVTST